MSRWPDRWIVVENWDRFQGRRERPGAPWIKLYRSLLHKTEWVDLSFEDQALLVNIWLLYAEEDGRLRLSDVIRWTFPQADLILSRSSRKAHHQRISRGSERLNRAGFIGFCDDKPLPLSLNPLDARARANGGPPTPPCPECEVGGGMHAAGCSRAGAQA